MSHNRSSAPLLPITSDSVVESPTFTTSQIDCAGKMKVLPLLHHAVVGVLEPVALLDADRIEKGQSLQMRASRFTLCLVAVVPSLSTQDGA